MLKRSLSFKYYSIVSSINLLIFMISNSDFVFLVNLFVCYFPLESRSNPEKTDQKKQKLSDLENCREMSAHLQRSSPKCDLHQDL